MLTQGAGTDGCLSPTDAACAPIGPMADPFGLAVSPDGENVFVAASLDGLIAIFDRKTSNGLLSQKRCREAASPTATARALMGAPWRR